MLNQSVGFGKNYSDTINLAFGHSKGHSICLMEYLLDHAFDFYGCDWAAMIFTFISLYQLGNKSRMGFLVGIVANVFWFSYGYQTDSIANMFCSFVVICLQARGWKNWHLPPPNNQPEPLPAE